MNGQRTVTDRGHDHHHGGCPYPSVSWTAILAGALVGIGLSFLLHLFSVGIGLSAYTTNTTDGTTAIAIGGLIGVLIGSIAAMFAQGYTAGYLARPYCANSKYGAMYGFLAWCLALLLTAFLAANMARYVADYTTSVSRPRAALTNNEGNTSVVAADTRTGNIDAEKATGTSFLIFLLFAIGALSSAFGGHYGMACREREPTIV